MKKYHNFSGGAEGSDMFFEIDGEERGIETTAFSFYGHKTSSKNKVDLSKEELSEGWEHVLMANKSLKRNIYNLSSYIKNLLARDWFQVKNSDAIYAIGSLQNGFTSVDRGTGWACQMAIDNKKPVYVFDQSENNWHEYQYDKNKFEKISYVPKLTENFAGIGTRKIKEIGKLAITNLYENNDLIYKDKIL